MNIFHLDNCPQKAAEFNINKHVVKIPLEISQMLSTCFHLQSDLQPKYKPTHINHPMNVWVRETKENFIWVSEHGIALCHEYTKRYNKTHSCQTVIEWCLSNIHNVLFTLINFTNPPLCMPDDVKCNDYVESYRNYYRKYKVYDKRGVLMAKWPNKPYWW